ncbi:hypothetical protein JW887_03185 [Candidatus Dojkabacteria bacterium]|nr:hypothetical protein [Candidatus Dojkabacteria bacterium]
MIKKNQIVVYPIHGVGKVVDIFSQEFNEEKMEYCRIEFLHTPIAISVPLEKATDLGLRPLNSPKDLQKNLKKLTNRKNVSESEIKNISIMVKDLIDSGSLDEAVEAISILCSAKKQLLDNGKNVSRAIERDLDTVKHFVGSEVREVLGEKYIERYNLQEE